MGTGLRRFTGNGALEQLNELAKEGSADSNEASTEDADLFLSKEDISEPKAGKVCDHCCRLPCWAGFTTTYIGSTIYLYQNTSMGFLCPTEYTNL